MSDTNDLSCWVYKSLRKEEMYLFLAEKDGFDLLSEPLKQVFGLPVFVMELELNPERKLARAEVETVMNSIREQGFYLQMPPKVDTNLYFGD